MIIDGRVSIDRLISGESLLLGSTKDVTFAAFFVPCKSTYKLNHIGKLEKHNQEHQKWSAGALPSRGFAPLSPWVEQRCLQPMAPQIPMVPRNAPLVGFGGAMSGLPVWVAKKSRIKKQRDRQALALGGHQSMKITNNQPKDGRSDREDVWVEARG